MAAVDSPHTSLSKASGNGKSTVSLPRSFDFRGTGCRQRDTRRDPDSSPRLLSSLNRRHLPQEARQISEYCKRGELVPDELTVSIFRNWLEGRRAADKFRPKEHLLLLDGIPRTVNQCKLIERYIDVKLVLYFECVDMEVMVDRIRRRAVMEGRPDDASESVTRKRLETFERETTPVLNYYGDSLIRRIDSSGLPAEVLAGCLQQLIPVLKENFVFE